jgi:hypothetical protein
MNAHFFIFITLIMFPCVSKTMEHSEKESYQQKIDAFKGVAQRYTEFLNQCGRENPGDIIVPMTALFSGSCQKHVNGRPLSTNIIELLHNILHAKQQTGIWSVTPLAPAAVCLEPNAPHLISTYYSIQTQRVGLLFSMQRLQVNDDKQISAIYEVCSKQ